MDKTYWAVVRSGLLNLFCGLGTPNDSSPFLVIFRMGFEESIQSHKGLSERSQAVGAILSLLLVALTGCLLALLLYKKERR